MARTFWVAVGAAGGIYAYKRGQRAVEDAKQRGFSENMQVAAGLAATAGSKAKRLAGAAEAAVRSGRASTSDAEPQPNPRTINPRTINEVSAQPADAQKTARPPSAPYTTTTQKTRRPGDQPENPWTATSNGLS